MADHLLVTNDFPPKTGGIQVYLFEMWSRLEPGRGVVLTASSHPEALEFDEASNLIIERVPASTLYWPSRSARRAIQAAIDKHQPRLVVFDPAWPLARLGPKLSVPYGLLVHGAELSIPAHVPFLRAGVRRILSRAAFVICTGVYPEAEVRRVTGTKTPPILQIPPGVETARFVPLNAEQRANERMSRGIGVTDSLVVSYSRLVPRKGFDVLIRAAALLKQRVPNLRVVIGGTGRDQRRLEKIATKLNSPVQFIGRVSNEELPTWLASADLMVMNCRTRWAGLEQEGFGIVFAEASASGVAAIAGRSGGSHEAVLHNETGLIMDRPKNAHDLADAMFALLRDPERRHAMANAARGRAVKDHDWEALAAALSEQLAPFDGYVEN